MPDHSLLLETPPRGWAPASFSEVCTRVQDAALPSADGERLYLGLEHLASGLPSLVGRGKESDVRSGKTSFRKGDVLFGKLRPYLRKSVLVVEDGICSTDILVFRASAKCVSEFLCLLTHTNEFVGHAKATTSGVQHPRTSWAGLRDFKLHVPPLPEQRKIAAVLGAAQRAIEQQERLLQLTVELKKTLLHQLFTHGLHGEPQKQTEIGPVPQSWEVNKIGEHCSSSAFGPRFSSDLYASDGNVVTLHTTDLDDDGNIDYRQAPKARIDNGKFESHLLKIGDVVVSRSGTCGIAAVFEGLDMPVVPGAFLIRVRLTSGLRPQFLRYYINSPVGRPRIMNLAQGAIQKNISGAALKEFEVPVPSIEDQADIEAHVEAIDRKLQLHSRKKQSLAALFRTLLQQSMTAQIRVNDLDLSVLEM